ncbi:hypothetical protein BDF14DRAFT_1719843 [Spinellus fusiger]|nr:hypothetical protein BDF14DRAFT_1719843 [Spinellus fusiger]
MFIPTGQTKQQFVERTRAERQQREKERKDKDKTNQQEAAVVRIQQWWKQQKTLAAVRNECWTLWDEQLLLHHEATSILDLFYLVGLYCLFSKRSTLQTKGRLPIVCKYLAQKYPGTTKDTVISYHALLVDVRYMERARRYLCHILHQCLDQMCLGKNMEDQTMYLTGLELSTLVYFLNPKTYKIPSLLSIDCAVESAMEVVRVAALKVIKESLLTYSSSMLRNSAIVRVARMAKIEDRGKTHSKGPLSPEDTRIIQSIKLWLTTLTRISMFPLEYAPTATHLWTTAEALDCVVTIVLGIPLLTTLLEPNMLSLLPTWHLLNTKGKNGAQWIDSLEGNGGLFLLANLVDGWQKLGIQPSDEPKVTQAADGLLSMITPYFSERQTKHHCCYHPLFKWSSAIWGNTLPASVFDRVILQIHFLWSRAFMDPSFTPILTFEAKESQKEAPKSFGGPFFQSFHKKKSQPESQNLYGQLAEFSMDVEILFSMYTQGQMLIYLDAAKKQDGSEIEKEPLIQVLKLFCEICSLVFLTLDDTDIFQKETPFSIKHLIDLSGFLNVFYFALVQQQGSTPTTLPNSVHSFHAARRLLLQLYDLDVRHSYCPQGHWLLVPDPSTKPSVLSLLNASSPKPSEFLTHFRQGDRMPLRILQLMPHTVSFDTRLKIFRDWIYMDRATSTTTRSKVITVRRNHVLEDGFSGLSDLPSSAWKSTIRVSFVNELGMEEAGIDQGGPFKDFISLFIADALKPSCGLFDSTPTTHLFYPSPMSHLQGQSIEYFNLIGKVGDSH